MLNEVLAGISEFPWCEISLIRQNHGFSSQFVENNELSIFPTQDVDMWLYMP